MAFNREEARIIAEMGKTDTGYPFNLSDKELDIGIQAIKRERGDALAQAKRKIRVDLANKLGWTFAMDGGFMEHGSKDWPYGGTMFAKLYQEYEKLMLAQQKTK